MSNIGSVLRSARTIAVIGLSSKRFRPSFGVAEYMQSSGYRIIPVNPFETEVLGEKAYPGDTIASLLYKIIHEQPDLTLIPKGPQWERLNRVLVRAAEKNPDDRYPDAAAMASELTDALLDLGGSPDWTTRSDQGLMVRTRTGPRALQATVASAPTTPSALEDVGATRQEHRSCEEVAADRVWCVGLEPRGRYGSGTD